MEETLKVKAIWVRVVYSTSEYSGDADDPVGFFEYDEQETLKLEHIVHIDEYDSVEKALCDFLSSNMTDRGDDVFLKEKTVLDKEKNQLDVVDSYLYVAHPNMKKENGEFVVLSDEEFSSRFDGESKFRMYSFRNELHVEYIGGPSADLDLRKIYKKKYEEVFCCATPEEKQKLLDEMKKKLSE